jgi:hypothetical protein
MTHEADPRGRGGRAINPKGAGAYPQGLVQIERASLTHNESHSWQQQYASRAHTSAVQELHVGARGEPASHSSCPQSRAPHFGTHFESTHSPPSQHGFPPWAHISPFGRQSEQTLSLQRPEQHSPDTSHFAPAALHARHVKSLGSQRLLQHWASSEHSTPSE